MRSLPLLLLAITLSACSVGTRLFGPADGEDAATAAGAAGEGAGPLLDARGLAVYLETMQALAQGDPVLQAEVFQDVARAAEVAPTTTNRLQFALALATPGHPSSQPLQAQRLLSELLAAGDALLPEERILTTIHLKEVEQRLILDAEAERLQRDAQTELTRLNAENDRRLQQAQLENQRLRAELEDAQEKLEAITSIERSIRERENGTDAP